MTYTVIRDWTQISPPAPAGSAHVLRGEVVSRHRTHKAALRRLNERQRAAEKLPASWKPDFAVIEEQGVSCGADGDFVWGTTL